MTAVLMTLGVVGFVLVVTMDRDVMSDIPKSPREKTWFELASAMLVVSLLALMDFWDALSPADPIRKIVMLAFGAVFLWAMGQSLRPFCHPYICGFRRERVFSRASGEAVGMADWRHWETGRARPAQLPSLLGLSLLLWFVVVLVPEDSPARLMLARIMLVLSTLCFVLVPLLVARPTLVGLEREEPAADVMVACLLSGNVFLFGTIFSWPEAVSVRACFDPGFMLALCGVLLTMLLIGYVDVYRRAGASQEDRKNGRLAFWQSFCVLAGCTLVVVADVENPEQSCDRFREGHPSMAQSAAERGRPPVQVVRADPAQAGAIRVAAVGEAGSSKNGPAAKGGTRTPSAPEPASPPPMSTVDTLRAGLSVIDSRLTISFLEEPSRGVYRLGLNWWHADLGDSSHAIGRGAEALREAGALVAGSGLRFASVEMRLMGMVQDRYGVRRARPLMRWLLDDKTMAPIQWAVIDGSDLLDLASVELEAEGLVPLMGYCDEDGHARESPVFCRLAGLRRGDREARLRRQLDELCEAVGTDLDDKYDDLETIEDLCRDI